MINAPAEIIFAVITDYESYDELLPTLHDSIKIVSPEKTGMNVSWESTGTFKGHSFTTVWTVTEFTKNRSVKMEDLAEGIGETILKLNPITEGNTIYTMYISTKMFKPYEKEFIKIYREEMAIIKAESERLYKEQNL
jgi:hypothetical protein